MIPQIILAIENEDDRAFMTQLYLDYQYIMYAEIKKLVSDSWVIEDIMQDALVRLIDKIDLLQQLNTRRRINYLITTVRNQTKNYYRAKQHAAFSSLDDEESPLYRTVSSDEDLEEYVFHMDMLGKLQDIWPRLSDTSQQLLERKYILEQSDAEIAEAFEIKPSSVRMKLTRARKEAFDLLNKRQIP